MKQNLSTCLLIIGLAALVSGCSGISGEKSFTSGVIDTATPAATTSDPATPSGSYSTAVTTQSGTTTTDGSPLPVLPSLPDVGSSCGVFVSQSSPQGVATPPPVSAVRAEADPSNGSWTASGTGSSCASSSMCQILENNLAQLQKLSVPSDFLQEMTSLTTLVCNAESGVQGGPKN